MGNWLKALIGGGSEPAQVGSLDQQRELQSLRLELAQRDQEIAGLQREIARIRDRSDELAQTTSQAQLEPLLTDLSRLVGLLLALTADRGMSAEDDSAQLANVADIVKQLPQVMQDCGWQPVGHVGEVTVFDPNLHTPLAQDESPKPVQPVMVRWPGGAYAGHVLWRAGITLNPPADEQAGR